MIPPPDSNLLVSSRDPDNRRRRDRTDSNGTATRATHVDLTDQK